MAGPSASDIKRLIAGMDVLTARNLALNPPADTETMQQWGIGPVNLDQPMRKWINRKFRAPAEKAYISPGKVKSSTKFSDLKKMVFE
jgi:hypothetical protein